MRNQWRKQSRRVAVVMSLILLTGSFSSFGAQSDELLNEIQSITGSDTMNKGVPQYPEYTARVEKTDGTVNTFASEQTVNEQTVVRENGEKNEQAVGPGLVQNTLASEELSTETATGPTVKEIQLSETYHEEFQIYTESIDGRFFIYSNVSNNGMTDLPVSLDIPSNVSYRVEKDGSEFSYTSKQSLTETGTYVFYFTAVKDDSLPLSKQTIYETTFNFRIQPKPPTIESEENSTNADGSSTAGDFTANLEQIPESSSAVATDFMEGQTTAVETEAQTEPASEPSESVSIEESEEAIEVDSDLVGEETESQQSSEHVNTTVEDRKSISYTQIYDTESGMYQIALSDMSYFYSNVPNGMLSNVGVTLDTTHLGMNAEEITVLKDGEFYSMPDKNMFTEVGSYLLFIPQGTGQAIYSFYILGQANADLDGYTLPEMMTVTFASLNGETIPVNTILSDGKSRLQWEKDGSYHLTLQNQEGIHTEIDVEIDREAPKFSVAVQDYTGEISYGSTDIEEIVVNKDGQETSYSQISQLREPGNYTITVYDYARNASSMSVVVPKQVNIAGVIAIILVIGLIAAGVIFFRQTKKNFSVK